MPITKVAYVAHVPGHKNSQGEAAPWVVKSHEDGHIISSHKSKAEAKQHLRDMHAHSGSKKSNWLIVSATVNSLDAFTRAYIEAAFFTSTDDSDQPLDSKYTTEDLAPSALDAIIKDCQQFQQENAEALDERGDVQGGHDFWLTRNGHGAGFWDGDWPENGKALTLASKKYGEADLYIGDDGYIYQYGKETPGPVPPREEYNPTPEELADLKAMGIKGSKHAAKTAVYVEEQWEDILKKKGYVEDESTESAWEDTLYINPSLPDVQVLLHESGESYYIVELNGEVIEQGTEPDKLWEALNRAPELYRKSIKHDREMNEADIALMKEMGVGVTAHIKSGLLRKKEPKMAFEFNRNQQRQYDYEASGNNMVLISPANTTKLLEGDAAKSFWLSLDHLENAAVGETPEEYTQKVQELIRGYFETDRKAAKYVVQVDATSLKKASVTFIAGVDLAKDGTVEKLKFTSSKAKAETFSQSSANKIVAQLSDFRLTGSLVKG
jgi:hypothetical protein